MHGKVLRDSNSRWPASGGEKVTINAVGERWEALVDRQIRTKSKLSDPQRLRESAKVDASGAGAWASANNLVCHDVVRIDSEVVTADNNYKVVLPAGTVGVVRSAETETKHAQISFPKLPSADYVHGVSSADVPRIVLCDR